MRIILDFPWRIFLFFLLVFSLGLVLGNWQTRRAQQKEQIFAQTQARQLLPVLDLLASTAQVEAYRSVRLRGQWRADWPLYLDNRPLQGQAGFYVLMPFQLEASQAYVLVARGWQVRNVHARTTLPALQTPMGSIEIEGQVRERLDRSLALGQAEVIRAGGIVQNLELRDLVQASGLAFAPFIVEQTSMTQDGLQRVWPQASAGADKHRAYAFQWYALSGMSLIFFAVIGFRGFKRGNEFRNKIRN